MNPAHPQPPRKASVVPVAPAHWRLLVDLFGPHGACADCWCMWWRRPPPAWRSGKRGGNRRALHRLIARSSPPPGVLALADGRAVGWCAVAPRQAYSRLDRSRVLAPIDDQPVWSITCLFVARDWRRQGLTTGLLEGAVQLAQNHGAACVEGYPIDPQGKTIAHAFLYTGCLSTFRKAGFLEVTRRSSTRPIVRRDLSRA